MFKLGKRSMHRVRRPRSGFTVVELLVALAIISLLLGLTLPAVQRVREVSRRATCMNRLRQLGLACQSFETIHGHFPDTNSGLDPNGRARGSAVLYRGHAVFLDHLGYAALSRQLEWDSPFTVNTFEPPSVPWPSETWKTAIPDFVCPSDTPPPGATNYRTCFGTSVSDGASWRPGEQPSPSDMFNESLPGIFTHPTRPAQITDGLSNTVLFSERIVGDGDRSQYTPSRDLAGYQVPLFLRPNEGIVGCSQGTIPVTTDSYLGWSWAIGDHRYNHVATPNSRIPDCLSGLSVPNGEGVLSARSWHPGGVNIVLADGATRFVSDSVDLRVWRGIGTKWGTEVISGSDF